MIGHLRKGPPLARIIQVFNDDRIGNSGVTDVVTLTNYGRPQWLDVTPARYLAVKHNRERALHADKLVEHIDYMRLKHLSNYCIANVLALNSDGLSRFTPDMLAQNDLQDGEEFVGERRE